MSDFFNNIKIGLEKFLNTAQEFIFALLPDSPFKDFSFPSEIQDILSYINWLVPFYLIGNTLLVWTSAITVYYAYQTILRWIKSIQ